MSETTLGQRIMIEAREMQIGSEEGAWYAQHQLEALADRADAAERGMVAFAEDVTPDNWHRVVAERTEALAAWRAIREVGNG